MTVILVKPGVWGTLVTVPCRVQSPASLTLSVSKPRTKTMKPNLILLTSTMPLSLALVWFELLNWYDCEYGAECPKQSLTWISDYLSLY